MKLTPRIEISDKYEWRCTKKICRLKRSICKGMWFELSRLTFIQLLQTTYFWALRYHERITLHEMSISEKTCVDCYRFCREICAEIVLADGNKIGGQSIVVEIDESKFEKGKYHRANGFLVG